MSKPAYFAFGAWTLDLPDGSVCHDPLRASESEGSRMLPSGVGAMFDSLIRNEESGKGFGYKVSGVLPELIARRFWIRAIRGTANSILLHKKFFYGQLSWDWLLIRADVARAVRAARFHNWLGKAWDEGRV